MVFTSLPTQNDKEIGQMTEIVVENDAAAALPSMIEIPVKTGYREERVVEIEFGSSVTKILEIISAERGCAVEELVLIRDDCAEPLTAVVVVEVDYPHKRHHHVHHVGEVAVTVYYQAKDKTQPFRRNATVEDVLTWALKAFGVDTSMASEFELTRHDEKEELPGTEHIGHLAGKHGELALDLVRGDIANGSGA
jgi:hypothetical protein